MTEARAETEDYPPFADRFEALIGQIEAPRHNHFWVFAASLLLATLRRLDPRTPVRADTPDKLCSVLIQAVRTATPDVLIRER